MDSAQTHRLCISEFNAWLDKRLVQKYTPCLVSLVDVLRPLLRSLQTIRTRAAEMGVALSTVIRFGTTLNMQRQCVDNTIHLIDRETALPECPLDFDFLTTFIKRCESMVVEISRNITALHSSSLKEAAIKRTATEVKTIVERLPVELGALQEEIDSPMTRGITMQVGKLKQQFADRTNRMLVTWDFLHTTEQQQLPGRLQVQRGRLQAAQKRHADVRQWPLLVKEQTLQQRCERLQRSVGGMLQPFVRASQMVKGGSKGKKGGLLLGGLELSSEEASLLHRNTQLLLRHLSPGAAEGVVAPAELLRELQGGLEDFLHCLHLLTEAVHQLALQPPKSYNKEAAEPKSPKEAEAQREVAAACASFEHTALRSSLEAWRDAAAELRAVQVMPELLTCTEAFKSAERDLAATKRELAKVVEEYRTALGLYHRTVREFSQLRYQVAQCCVSELGLLVEIVLPKADPEE